MKDDMTSIPYAVLEAEQTTHERNMRRMLVALVISILLLFASNMAWLWFFNSFDIESSEITVDSTEQGNANYVGENGVIGNGRSESQND